MRMKKYAAIITILKKSCCTKIASAFSDDLTQSVAGYAFQAEIMCFYSSLYTNQIKIDQVVLICTYITMCTSRKLHTFKQLVKAANAEVKSP